MYIVVFFIIGSFIGISQSAGIGGGPILNICLMIGLGYSSREAMSITYIFLMGGSLAAIIMNSVKKNHKGYPIMDYTLILMTLPMIMSGSIYGTILNHYFSQLLITISFTILLVYLAYNSYQKYREYEKQNAAHEANQILLRQDTFFDQTASTLHPTLQSILEGEKCIIQKQKFKIAFYVLVYSVTILLFRGARTYNSLIGLQACHIGFWMCNILHLALSYLFSKSVGMQKFKIDYEKQKLGYKIRPEEKLNQLKMRNSMIYGFVAGMAGGCLGLGGAIILVPVWLNSGIDKDIATSSSGPLIFLSSFSAFFLSWLGGSYELDSAVGYFVLSFLSSLIVKKIVSIIAQRCHLKAMVYILLLFTMLISIVTLLPYQMFKYYANPEAFLRFGELC